MRVALFASPLRELYLIVGSLLCLAAGFSTTSTAIILAAALACLIALDRVSTVPIGATTMKGIPLFGGSVRKLRKCFPLETDEPDLSPPSRSLRNAVQFKLESHPINHYGERIRWLLQSLRVPFEEEDNAAIIGSFFFNFSVPRLYHGPSGSVLGNSDQCVFFIQSFLQQQQLQQGEHSDTYDLSALHIFSQNSTTARWNERLSRLGHCIQVYVYQFVTKLPGDISNVTTAWGAYEPHVPFIQRMLLRVSLPVLIRVFRVMLLLDNKAVLQRVEAFLNETLDAADKALKASGGRFLTGDRLNAVDLFFCSLTAPLFPRTLLNTKKYTNGRFSSQHYNLDIYPRVLLELEEALLKRPCGQFVVGLYQFRGETASTLEKSWAGVQV